MPALPVLKSDHRLEAAHRIHLMLRRELGEGVDVRRLQFEPLYARDVLLVCDALAGTALPALAQHFRQTLADAGPVSSWAADSSDFDHESRVLPSALVGKPRHWLSPGRWFGPR